MQRSFSNAVHSAPNMYPGLSQSNSQPPASKPSNSQRSGFPTGGSVSRSEAGVSVDLSAASNTAAQGEDPMEGVRGNVSGGAFDSRPVQRAKSREAEKWFEDSNRNASTRGNVSFVDDDPPFHLPSQMPNDDSPHGLPMRASGILHHPSALPVQSLESSNSDEFRSVIDDLTIENKKLKKENIQLKRRNITHSHPDKLFEVRMHGLDAKEKKQLMQMLLQFNDSLSLSRGNSPRTSGRKRSKKGSNKPSSSSTLHSNSNLVDSAYASGSTSGHASGTPQQMAESRTAGQSDMARRSRGADKDQNVRSYLMNMSKGLLPKQPVAMTEKARKKLVVRKLEELYTGKPNTTKKNSQSAQQQLISTEAAIESKHQSEAKGQSVPTEGSREAVILPVDTDVPNLQHESSFSMQSDGATIGTPDQRPTRPLDLDMSKAQNPAENIAYIRHLGFKPSEKIRSGQVQAGGGNGSGIWVPLNLLMNLAQLHTLNVTTEFVRQAIKEISVRFELTSDESKVRWKGGTEGTRMIGESASSAGSNENSPTEGSQDVHGARQRSPSRSRSSKPSNSEQTTGGIKSGGDTTSGTKDTSRDMSLSTGFTSNGNAARGKRPVFLSSTSREDSISYQPIFLHGANSEEENDYFLDENDSLMSSGIREDTTGSGSGQRSKRLVSVPKEEGPVIFYHRARFCTDLSGDHDIVPVNNTRYMRATTNIIGLDHIEGVGISETKSLLNASEIIRRHAVIEEPEAPPIRVIDGRSPVFISAESILAEPYVFMATGMYDTLLSNNIMLWAQHRQMVQRRSKPVFNRCQEFLRTKLLGSDMVNRIGFSERLAVMLKPEGCETRELPPSEVPSPGFYNQWSSSESANGLSDLDDEYDSKSEEAEAIEAPGILPTFGNTAFGSHSGEGEDSEDEEDEEDGVIDEDDMDEEVDMLAFEREQNADEIARREREWEEQLKDDVGDAQSDGKRSSAATVGDRSFLSEEDGMSPGRISAGAVAGQKRERDEQAPPDDGSPAKRLESDRSRDSRR